MYDQIYSQLYDFIWYLKTLNPDKKLMEKIRDLLRDKIIEKEHTKHLREGIVRRNAEWEEETLKEFNFQQDFDFYGIRWMQEGRWGSPNLQHEDPDDEEGWPPNRSERYICTFFNI